MNLLPSGQRGRLPVNDRLERLAQHVIKRRRGGDHYDREARPVGQRHRCWRHLGEVLVQFHAEARQAVSGQLLDQLAELLRLAGQRVSSSQQELILLGPPDDVRHRHGIEPPDEAVKPIGSGDDLRPAHGFQAEHFADRQRVGRGLAAAPPTAGQRDDVPAPAVRFRMPCGRGAAAPDGHRLSPDRQPPERATTAPRTDPRPGRGPRPDRLRLAPGRRPRRATASGCD